MVVSHYVVVSGRNAAVFDHSSMSPAPSNHSLRREVQWEKDEESKHILERMPRVCLDIKTSHGFGQPL